MTCVLGPVVDSLTANSMEILMSCSFALSWRTRTLPLSSDAATRRGGRGGSSRTGGEGWTSPGLACNKGEEVGQW